MRVKMKVKMKIYRLKRESVKSVELFIMTECFNVKIANAVIGCVVKGVNQNDIKLEMIFLVVKNARVQKKGLKFTINE
jgi:hypothetical protein